MPEPFFSKILVPVDFSACSDEAFRVACALARVFSSEVILLHVVDTKSLENLNRLGLAPPTEEKAQKKRLNRHARATARRLLSSEAAKGLPIRRAVVDGAPFVEIVRLARSEKVQLVVMGTHGSQVVSVEKMFFGSTAEKVVRTAGCPVLTVPLPAKLPAGKGATA